MYSKCDFSIFFVIYACDNKVPICIPEEKLIVAIMIYFLIYSPQSGKVLDASQTNQNEVILWKSHGGDNQLWFWDGKDILRNKEHPNKVRA